MKWDEGKVLLLLMGILSGIVITSFIVNASGTTYNILTYDQYQNLNIQINQLNSEVKGLDKQYNELSKKLMNYKNNGGKSKNILEALEMELKEVKRFYGNSDVEGPGLRIIIDDRHKPSYVDSEDIMNSTTHDFDIRYIINELRAAGAEAISVNGKRITNLTSITCSGPIIEVDKEAIVPPFEILAIGNSDTLKTAVSLPESHFQNLVFRELSLKITTEKKIKIFSTDRINNALYLNEKK